MRCHEPALVALLAAALAYPCHAQDFPAKSLRIVVPAGAGGAADILARALGERFTAATGHAWVVDNRPSAGGIVGSELVARAAADGYTLLVTSNTFIIAPSLYRKLPFDIGRDFAAVGLIASTPNLLVINAERKVRSIGELIALARRSPEGVDYGSPAVGSAAHLTMELFKRNAGIALNHVPFKGPQAAMLETLANRVPLTIAGVSNALPHLKAGRIVALASTEAKRSRLAPDVPTLAEAGVQGIDLALWFGVFTRAGTPSAVLSRLNREIDAAAKSAEGRERLLAQGFEPIGGAPSVLEETVRREQPLYASLVARAGLKVE